MEQDFYSVGIDIGTTTTQLIFSRLSLEKTGGFTAIPNIKIAKKEVVYKSAIYFTPLLSNDIVDSVRLKDIISEEYKKSSIDISEIATGAIIITGESARKENAQQVIKQLAEFAGDFVVCTAGPDYEAVLAGWGSGAGELSKRITGNIINFDIGGGTTNAAVFQNGEVLDAFAADIGGRLVKINADGFITYISGKIEFLIHMLNLHSIKIGCKADFLELSRLTDRMAEMFIEFSGEKDIRADTYHLFISHPSAGLSADHIMFSGGVAEYIYGDVNNTPENIVYRYGDIGPLLGLSIRHVLSKISAGLIDPAEKIRATVVGAGSYSTSISGSTITFDEIILPIKNIPVVKILYSDDEEPILSKKISARVDYFEGGQIAIAICGIVNPQYKMIRRLADIIAEGLENSTMPIIVITECDCAKALGLLLRNLSAYQKSIVCLDKIHVEDGDFIDIGKPISGVIPVIVKTLIFNH